MLKHLCALVLLSTLLQAGLSPAAAAGAGRSGQGVTTLRIAGAVGAAGAAGMAGMTGMTSAGGNGNNAGDAVLAWQAQGEDVQWTMLAGAADTDTPLTPALAAQYRQVALGSVWKLFVYIYLQQSAADEAPFACTKAGNQRDDEQYCCEPGQSIGRELALARSCGRYFEPQRLHLEQGGWQQFWQKTLPAPVLAQAPWLLQLARLRPQTEVTPQSLLAVLGAMPAAARDPARSALLTSSLQGTVKETLPFLGSAPRMKTFTWDHPLKKGMRLGGAAGWLPNGTVFWFAATGSSRNVLQYWGPALASRLQALHAQSRSMLASSNLEEPCVEVEFFKRYPLRKVQAVAADKTMQAASPGLLQGPYQLTFENGNSLPISASGQMYLRQEGNARWRISGRFALNDYVARVVEREGLGSEVAAARALAVAARSYLLQNGVPHGACYQIADDSRRQRVSPNRPGDAALAASWFSDGLVLSGVPVRYHQEQGKDGVLAWNGAVAQGQAGWQFDQILLAAFPQAALRGLKGGEDCQRLPDSERWLQQMQQRWQALLQAETGFERLAKLPLVCALDYGNPYSDQRRMRVYVRPQLGYEERITLAHEYLHLSFRFHPRGLDESYLEQWARKLVDGNWLGHPAQARRSRAH